MPNTKPTAGPWTVGQTFSTHNAPVRNWETYVISASTRAKLTVAKAIGETQEEAEANARVIATAHELLNALEILMNYTGGWDEKPTHPCGVARAAIIKAKGEL